MQYTFIVNPVSGTHSGNHTVAAIRTFIERNKISARIQLTEKAEDATHIAHRIPDNSKQVVVAVGGDGTVHEVIKGIHGSKKRLAILPVGSGNGLARHLGIPTNLKRSLACLLNFKAIEIDIGTVQGELFGMLAGVGFDAYVAKAFQSTKTRGLPGYIKAALKAYPNYKAINYQLAIDDDTFERTVFMIVIANGSEFGNNAKIAPGASITDGMLDVCFVQKPPLHALPAFLTQLFTGTLNHSKYVELVKGKRIELFTQVPLLNIDGESLSVDKKLTFSIHPIKLNVLVSNHGEEK